MLGQALCCHWLWRLQLREHDLGHGPLSTLTSNTASTITSNIRCNTISHGLAVDNVHIVSAGSEEDSDIHLQTDTYRTDCSKAIQPHHRHSTALPRFPGALRAPQDAKASTCTHQKQPHSFCHTSHPSHTRHSHRHLGRNTCARRPAPAHRRRRCAHGHLHLPTRLPPPLQHRRQG